MIKLGKVNYFIPPELIEPSAQQQIDNTASMEFVTGMAIMPDVHFGMGSTVGTVVVTQDAIMPACVGVDIGCGMIAVKTDLTLEQMKPHLKELLVGIERRIPVGVGLRGLNSNIHPSAAMRIAQLESLAEELWGGDKNYMNRRSNTWRQALGTLGGGNHFIEICVGHRYEDYDNDGIGATFGPESIWVILHSGSRGVGNKTGTYWTQQAKMETKAISVLNDTNLSWLRRGTESFDEYLKELRWCQFFAMLNREEMMERVLTELDYTINCGPTNPGHGDFPRAPLELMRVNSHHNYVMPMGDGKWITRKGAIAAVPGSMSLIPGSMGTNSYIVEGLGNQDSYESAPHGAGRRMSRTKAKQTFTVESVTAEMNARGIEARIREAIVDEAPGSYKDIEETIKHAAELIKPVYQLRQILNVKGD